MQNLIKQEQFELEVLDKLNSQRLLSGLVFVGGTMLRLCYGLNRFSVDLDFWTSKKNPDSLFDSLKACLEESYRLTDSAKKHYTLLFEMRSPIYPRSLKLEIRKELKNIIPEQAIAYSPHANTQVKLPVISLKDMMKAKTAALLDRKQVRDAFDIEFLLRKGIMLELSLKEAKNTLNVLDGFSKNDYRVVLGALLEAKDKEYYSKEGFKLLHSACAEKAR